MRICSLPYSYITYFPKDARLLNFCHDMQQITEIRHVIWLVGWAFHLWRENSLSQLPFSIVSSPTTKKRRNTLSSLSLVFVVMASSSLSLELPVKKESISFAPPPPELQLPRDGVDNVNAAEDQPPQHPDSSHRRGSSTDASGTSRKGRAMSSPPPPPAYTPRGAFLGFALLIL